MRSAAIGVFLASLLASAGGGAPEKGIRVWIDPDLPVETALRALVVLARTGTPKIVCVSRKEKLTFDFAIGIPMNPAPDVPVDTPVTIPLTLDLR